MSAFTTDKRAVLGIGSPVVDQIARVPEAFLETVNGAKGGMELVDRPDLAGLIARLPDQPVTAPGGSAGNTTFALARLGMPSRFLGAVGADETGDFYRSEFSRIGGNGMLFRILDDQSTACCVSLVTPDGERTMRTHLGAAMCLSPDHIRAEDFSGCAHVHIEGYLLFNPDLFMQAVSAAKNAGCTISLDLASFEVVNAAASILPGILTEYVDMVFANEEEAEAFAGVSDPEACLDALTRHCRIAAVKIGSEGAWLRRDKETVRVPALAVENLVDTTGAGDLWAAGFLYGMMKTGDLAESGACGAHLGAAVVTREGAAIPDDEWKDLKTEIERIIQK